LPTFFIFTNESKINNGLEFNNALPLGLVHLIVKAPVVFHDWHPSFNRFLFNEGGRVDRTFETVLGWFNFFHVYNFNNRTNYQIFLVSELSKHEVTSLEYDTKSKDATDTITVFYCAIGFQVFVSQDLILTLPTGHNHACLLLIELCKEGQKN
jgi:hypothetical protein